MGIDSNFIKFFQTLDYREYNDSDEAELSEIGAVTDNKYLLEWLLKKRGMILLQLLYEAIF